MVAMASVALVGGVLYGVSGDSPAPSPRAASVERSYGKLPLHFEANRGQSDPSVDFLARGSGYTLFVTPGEAVLSLTKPKPDVPAGAAEPAPSAADEAVVRMKFLGASKSPTARSGKAMAGKVNYFVGSDRAAWRTGIPTFGEVSYRGMYPGVDLVYHGSQGQLEYDFVVAPGADPRVISLGFEGADRLALDDAGDLVISTPAGELRQARPVLYQTVDGKRRAVKGGFVLDGERVGFAVGAFDHSRPLVIDPVLTYSTFLGGNGADVGFGITVDPAGNAYVAGQAGSSNFPTAGGVSCSNTAFPTSSYQCDKPTFDAFVTKLNPAGSALVYSTYLGGGKSDIGYDIAIDDDGNAYVVGATDSADDPGTTAVEAGFPTTAGAFDTTCGTDGYCNAVMYNPSSCLVAAGCATTGSSDVFVAKLDASGSALLYSTYLGGSNNEQDLHLTAVPGHMGLAVHGSRAYVTSVTASDDDPLTLVDEGFPTTAAAFDRSCGSAAVAGCDDRRLDGFVSVIDTAASGAGSLVYSTYLGGSGNDEPKRVAVDDAGNAYVVGATAGFDQLGTKTTDFPVTPGAFQTAYKGGFYDAFVAKLSPSGVGPASLVWSTLLGGGGVDQGWDIAVEGGGQAGHAKAYVVGFTDSGDDPATPAADGPSPYFPTTASAFDTTFNGRATAVNGDTTFLNGDAFVAKLKADGSGLAYGTYLGGTYMDTGAGIDVDSDGNAYVTGYTTCENTNGGVPLTQGGTPPPPCQGSFPVVNAVQPDMDGSFIGHELHNSPTDIFLAKLVADGTGLSYATYLGGNDFDRGFAVAVRYKDADNNAITPEAYVTGRIASTNYPTTEGAFRTTKPAGKGNRDAAVSKVTG